jgi:hypothetical protein
MIPGFTAELALDHRARRRYAPTRAAFAHPASITPQMLPLGSRPPCIENCICISEDGCPCCPYPGPWPPFPPRTLPRPQSPRSGLF